MLPTRLLNNHVSVVLHFQRGPGFQGPFLKSAWRGKTGKREKGREKVRIGFQVIEERREDDNEKVEQGDEWSRMDKKVRNEGKEARRWNEGMREEREGGRIKTG